MRSDGDGMELPEVTACVLVPRGSADDCCQSPEITECLFAFRDGLIEGGLGLVAGGRIMWTEG